MDLHKEKNKALGIVALFSLTGALYWGMRGADGYGGMSGAVIPGLMWGLAWYYFDARAGRRADWIAAACAVGFGAGGFNGYGQFIAWMNGQFHIDYPEKLIYIRPWIGFAWLFAVGAGWGGVGGHFLSAALDPEKNNFLKIIRFFCLPAGAAAGALIVSHNPGIFAPHYSHEMYSPNYCTDCARTLNTLPIVGAFWGMTLLGILYDVFRRRKRALYITIQCAFGFGLAFLIASPTQLLYRTGINFDWWKVWEMTIGAIGGATLACVYLMNRGAGAVSSSDRAPGFPIFESVYFLTINWVFINCSMAVDNRLGIHPFSPAALIPAVIFFAVSLLLLIRESKLIRDRDAAFFASRAAKRIFLTHAIFTVLAVIVTYQVKSVMVAFIILSGLIFTLLISASFRKTTTN